MRKDLTLTFFNPNLHWERMWRNPFYRSFRLFYAFIGMFVFLMNVSGQVKKTVPKTLSEIPVEWVDSLDGDFSFHSLWSYPESIYKNDKGELRCDGTCNPRIETMKDAAGNIKKDSLKIYYRLIDTGHYYHSLQAEAWCYEYFGSTFMNCFKNESGFMNCFSLNSVATHCSLKLSISEDVCRPVIQLNSIHSATGLKLFKCLSGKIIIDRSMYKKGILKASFDFTFLNSMDASKPMYWKGKIYTAIQTF